jgi:hypothetical protein
VFETKIDKKELLYFWCLTHSGPFSTNHVREWGRDYHMSSADVRVRELVRDGKLRKIPHNEAVLRGLIKKGYAPVAWYENP